METKKTSPEQSGPPQVVAVSCSPRAGGNSDHACRLFLDGAEAAGCRTRLVLLRHYDVHHCVSCQRCEHDPSKACFLEKEDQSGELFRMLLQSPVLFFASPVYFYHVPSHFKTFIDRCQCFWMRHQSGDRAMLDLPERKAYLAMAGARPRGEKLFEGSILTLKCFLRPFNFVLQEPLLFYGMDGPQELRENEDARNSLHAMGREACLSLLSAPAADTAAAAQG
ncbi:flavodoxin family protein [Desulfovibrio psychrotolerans]|uniref:Flavodoxin n=1 Tax=Desulfovibrio psychrotolerans TaxID=415242 RepID=A0A7J0BTT7_9BACT|nr:flavodoxin family protein [Desulfovibrio psychrotolerans]GFM37129.1 flavodoxin [Desulfovibrio psychrotolerans]